MTEQATEGGLWEPSDNLLTATVVIFSTAAPAGQETPRDCSHAHCLEPCLRGQLPGGCQHPAVPTLPVITALLSLWRCLLALLITPANQRGPGASLGMCGYEPSESAPCKPQLSLGRGQRRQDGQGEAGLAVGAVSAIKPQVTLEQWEHPAKIEPFVIVCPEVCKRQSKRWPGHLREFMDRHGSAESIHFRR